MPTWSRSSLVLLPVYLRTSRVAVFCFVLMLFASAASAIAASPRWTAVCDSEQHHFALHFKSPSGDVEEDDMRVTFTWDHNNPIRLPIKPAWFEPGGYLSDAKSLCKDVGGFAMGPQRVLILIRKDGRPSFDRIAAILVDENTGRVISTINDVGEIYLANTGPDSMETVLVTANSGYRILLIRDWRIDRNDGGEFGVPAWKRLTVKNNTLAAVWESP
jgi:hypothetical protein